MAVCNLFNDLTNATGNFLMFSQYVEDITRNFSNGENYKVIPTKFVALDIDYSKLHIPQTTSLNADIPRYFQNVFENGCAYLREKEGFDWTPEISRNLFWNYMFDGHFISSEQDPATTNVVKTIPQVVYYDDIDMHSYNEHKGMGYGEIYCYIPTDAKQSKCHVIHNDFLEDRQYDDSNKSNKLIGRDIIIDISKYQQKYYYNKDYKMSFDDSSVSELQPYENSRYSINTIVVLYSIFTNTNDEWSPMYENIPMGVYFTGMIEDGKMTNAVTKYVNTSYGSGTSYGLRICTRLSVAPNGSTLSSVEVVDDNNSANICQLMTAMNENLSKMLEVTKSAINTTQEYKETLATIKNNRTNVPYVKEVNGKDFWFVNGKAVIAVDGGDNCCNAYSTETVQKRFDNLMDEDSTNDYTYIEDPNGCECFGYSPKELAEELGLNPDNYPDSSYGPSTDLDGVLMIDSLANEDEIRGLLDAIMNNN